MPPASSDEIDLGPLGARLGFRLRLAQNAVLKRDKEAFGKLGLRPQEYNLLVLIDRAPGSMQRDVAAALGMREANLVPEIDKLQARALVSRSGSPTDARTRILDLTKNGKDLLRRAKRIDAGLNRRFDKRLGKGGRARLVRLLTRLVEPD